MGRGLQSSLSAAAQARKELRVIKYDIVDTGELMKSRHNDGQQQLRVAGSDQDGLPLTVARGKGSSSCGLADVVILSFNIYRKGNSRKSRYRGSWTDAAESRP